MIEAFYSGTSGLKAHQNALDVVSNNISNINTYGYKSKKQNFGDLLYSSQVRPETENSDILTAGSGSYVNSVDTDMSNGGADLTDSKTDFYIKGDGFFAVRDNAGNTYYTKDGAFEAINSGNGTILGTSDGLAVLDANGNTISAGTGGVSAEPGVFTFKNAPGLLSAGQNLFTANDVSGQAVKSDETSVQGMAERSNVDLAEQMTELITSQRGYQLSAGVVSTANQIEEMVNEMNNR